VGDRAVYRSTRVRLYSNRLVLADTPAQVRLQFALPRMRACAERPLSRRLTRWLPCPALPCPAQRANARTVLVDNIEFMESEWRTCVPD
jgi:hypothetical protein